MPIIWIGFSTQSSPPVRTRRRKPKELKTFVAGVVTKADRNAKLLDLYFEVGAERACALVKDLDDYVALQAVMGVLGADYFTKFLTADQADQAIKRQGGLVPKPRPRTPRR
jgi:hypothetical protein